MVGAKIKYVGLGRLMKEGRERRGLTVDNAASLLGMVDAPYLSRCEHGANNFPARKLRRALDLYGIPTRDAIEKATDDYRAGIKEFLSAEKKD